MQRRRGDIHQRGAWRNSYDCDGFDCHVLHQLNPWVWFWGPSGICAGAIQVGVEVFSSGGGAPVNDATATSLSVAPGATVMFGTCPAAGVFLDSNLAACIPNGSARILATSKKLVCTAFIADRFNEPPISM